MASPRTLLCPAPRGLQQAQGSPAPHPIPLRVPRATESGETEADSTVHISFF